jgi:hypothetical protein
MKDKNSLFTEMTAEEAANINGGGFLRNVFKRVWKGGRWIQFLL